jgi:hypothetical protein
MTQAKPLFLFLAPHAKAQSRDADAEPFLVVADSHSPSSFFINQDGVVEGQDLLDDDEDSDEGFDAVLDRIGHTGPSEFHLDLNSTQIIGMYRGTLLTVLSSLAPRSVNRDELEASLPEPPDMFDEGGLARTRDALVWVTSTDYGCDSPVNVEDFFEGKHIARADQALLRSSLEAAGVQLPKGVTLHNSLDNILVGVLPPTTTAHTALAQRARVLEDVRFFATLWEEMECPTRPIVPVFL